MHASHAVLLMAPGTNATTADETYGVWPMQGKEEEEAKDGMAGNFRVVELK